MIPSHRQILEMNARMISIMRYYHEGLMRSSDKTVMVSEIRAVAQWFVMQKLSRSELIQRVYDPIAAELIDRYGQEVGQQRNAAFVKVFNRKLATLTKLQGNLEHDASAKSVSVQREIDIGSNGC